MHKLNVSLHTPHSVKSKANERLQSSNEPEQNIGHENRLARVLTLHSKGYPQSEIAKLLNVNQSTISRDLNENWKEVKKNTRPLH